MKKYTAAFFSVKVDENWLVPRALLGCRKLICAARVAWLFLLSFCFINSFWFTFMLWINQRFLKKIMLHSENKNELYYTLNSTYKRPPLYNAQYFTVPKVTVVEVRQYDRKRERLHVIFLLNLMQGIPYLVLFWASQLETGLCNSGTHVHLWRRSWNAVVPTSP